MRASQIVGVFLHTQAPLILDIGVGLDANQDVLQRGVVLVRIVRVVGGYNGDVQLFVELHQSLVDFGQFGDVAVAHKLQEVAPAEQFFVPGCGSARAVHIAAGDSLGQLAAGAAGQHD